MIEAMIAQETVDEYREADRRFVLPCPIAREIPKRRPVWLGLYRICRALVRRRQETSAIRSARKDGEAAVMGVRMEASLADRRHNEQIQKLTRQNEDLLETVRTREDTIRVYAELTVPKLQRELEVEKAAGDYMAALHERELNLKKAEIAVSNMVITDGANREHQMERGTR